MRDLIASNAPLRGGSHKARQNGPKHYPGDPTGAANRGPAKAQRSGFGGERRSSGTTELLPRKAKRRMWSLRRRGTPFSSIFRRAAKDGVPEGRRSRRAPGKNVKRKTQPPEVVGLAPRLVNTQNLKNPLRNPLRNFHSIRRGGHNPPRVPGPFPAGVQARN